MVYTSNMVLEMRHFDVGSEYIHFQARLLCPGEIKQKLMRTIYFKVRE